MTDDDLFVTEKRLISPVDGDCTVCAHQISKRLQDAGHFAESMQFRMYTCPDCGNKRCPRGSWHENACTGSNDPGQEGSFYGKPTEQMLVLTLPEETE